VSDYRNYHYYVPPPLRKHVDLVYDALPKSLEEANKMFNPVEILQEASGKSRRFFESGGRDRQAGIEALIDTAMLGVGPAAYGVASLLRTPAKKSVDYATKAFQELFNPLGASDDRVVQTGTKGMTRRDFLGGTGAAAVTLAGAPILKEAGELLPEKGVVKTSADLFRQSLKNSNAAFTRIIQLKDAVKKADEATMKASREAIDKGLADPLEELFILKPKPDFVKKLEESQDVAVETLNKNLSEFVKDLTREKLLKLSDEELSILNKLKHVSPRRLDSTGNMSGFGKVFESGEPLRQRYIYDPDKDLQNLVLDPESVRVSELIDSVLIERGLFDRFIGLSDFFKGSTAVIDDTMSAKSDIGKAQGGVVSLRDEARDMFRKPKGIASLTV